MVKAIENSDFKDFEDCLQDRCVVSVAADYIVTRNEKDFAIAETKAITPEKFCELMEKRIDAKRIILNGEMRILEVF